MEKITVIWTDAGGDRTEQVAHVTLIDALDPTNTPAIEWAVKQTMPDWVGSVFVRFVRPRVMCRTDLMLIPDYAAVEFCDSLPIVWRNHHSCRTCTSEQVDWWQDWSCQCNDECAGCGAEIEPVESEWIGPPGLFAQTLWEALPDVVTP